MIKVSAPGSLMVSGEHAVLRGAHGMVMAVNQRLEVSLRPRMDRKITIKSALGEAEFPLDNLVVKAPFAFLLAVVSHYCDQLPSGFDCVIQSEICSTYGLASSAAMTVAMVGACEKWLTDELDLARIFQVALSVKRQVQGQGSGADLAASVYGGLLLYRVDPLVIESYPMFPLTVLYSGAKRPTPEVIAWVNQAEVKDPKRYQTLFSEMDQLSLAMAHACEAKNWPLLGECFHEHQRLMVEMGLSNPALDSLIHQLNDHENTFGAKISGSGLGDCAIGVSRVPDHTDWNLPAGACVVEVCGAGKGVFCARKIVDNLQ